MDQLKKSVVEVTRLLGSVVESKLKDRARLEEQAREFIEPWIAKATGKIRLRFKKLDHFRGDLPSYQTAGAAGFDVRACLDGPLTLEPGRRALVPTGLALEIPSGYEVQARPRSGLAIKKGLTLVNSPGTIDSDFRGEVQIILINLGQEAVTIADQERVAQLVVCPVVQAVIEDADDLNATARGAGGFGSTGV